MTDSGSSCCAPTRGTGTSVPAPTPAAQTQRDGDPTHTIEQVVVPAQVFAMGDHHGDGHPGDGETPVHEVTLSTFHIDATSITNAAFAAFTDATGYLTESERQGFSAVFHLAFTGTDEDILGTAQGAP